MIAGGFEQFHMEDNHLTELFFPMSAIPALADLRGGEWQNLLKHVNSDSAKLAEKWHLFY